MTLTERLKSQLDAALSSLRGSLSASSTPAVGDTHHVLEVSGWQSADCICSLAMYLVILRASVVDQAGRLCSELIANPRDFANDIRRSVDEIVVQPDASNESLADWKSKWRNPWIAEGIWHCCMRVAMENTHLHTPGNIIAIDLSHISPKDHGLDVTALYVKDDGTLGMSFVETKAYKNNPNKAIGDAVSMFKAIEAGEHDTRLRQMITLFKSSIVEPYKGQLAMSLWKNERTLIPNPHYELTGATVQWENARSSFADLKAPVVIMPHGVSGFDSFFDSVANEMRLKAQEIATYV
jgi:hypothetical protein